MATGHHHSNFFWHVVPYWQMAYCIKQACLSLPTISPWSNTIFTQCYWQPRYESSNLRSRADCSTTVPLPLDPLYQRLHARLVAYTIMCSTRVRSILVHKYQTSGLYYKPMTIVNDDSRVINQLENSLTDDYRVVIYNHHKFTVQAIGCKLQTHQLTTLW